MKATKPVRTMKQLVNAFGGDRAFGQAIYADSRDPWRAARNAKRRGRIPVSRWDATIRRANERGIVLTLETLGRWTAATAGKQHL